MTPEMSRTLGRILGSAMPPPTWDERNAINKAFGDADFIEDLPEDIQELLRRLEASSR